MADYREEMYLEMARSVEKALNILMDAQKKCEELHFEPTKTEKDL